MANWQPCCAVAKGLGEGQDDVRSGAASGGRGCGSAADDGTSTQGDTHGHWDTVAGVGEHGNGTGLVDEACGAAGGCCGDWHAMRVPGRTLGCLGVGVVVVHVCDSSRLCGQRGVGEEGMGHCCMLGVVHD